MKKKRLWSDIVIYSLLTIAALYTLFPLLMALMNSFKSNRELLTNVMSWPTEWNLDNYIRTYEKMHYGRSFVNTAILAGLSVSLIILFSALAGWKLCRTKTGLSRFLLKLFIFSMLIPFSSIMIPLYKVTLALGIKNSLLGLSFVYAGLGVSMAIFLYHGFVKSIPTEMEEAAAIDGCGSVQTFFRIVLPMLKPITATITITNVLWVWNDFLLPSLLVNRTGMRTLPLKTFLFVSQFVKRWDLATAGLVLGMVPILVFYLFCQKYIIKGVTEGALKG